MDKYCRFIQVLVFTCLPWEARTSLATIGVALLESKATHADNPQAMTEFMAITQMARQEVQGKIHVEAPTPQLPSFLEAVEALQAKPWPRVAVVGVAVAAVLVLLVLIGLVASRRGEKAASVHWSSVAVPGQPQSASSMGVRSVPGSVQVLEGRPASSKFSAYDAKSMSTTYLNSEHIQPSSAHTVESESTVRSSYPYINQKRAASSSSVASRISIGSSVAGGSSDVLCRALVVQQTNGVNVEFNGTVSADKQEGIFDVATAGCTIIRVLFSEFGSDSGILVESMMRMPIAFLNTKQAQCSDELSNERRVLICRSLPASAAAPCTDLFAAVMPDPNTLKKGCFLVSRGFNGPVLASVRLHGPDMCVTSADGSLMASITGHMNSTSVERLCLHIQPGVDASLVVCAMLAAIKLM